MRTLMQTRTIKIISGPLLGAAAYFLLMPAGHTIAKMGFITVWVAVWWMTEAMDLGATSLLPLVLLPVLGIMKTDEAAMQYMEQTIFLFIGGFFLAYALEKWELHHRFAYRVILLTGNRPSRLLAGIMFTAFFISMWISNTATVLMLIAAVTAILAHKELFSEKNFKPVAAALMTGLAYSATIGGMATLVGTPTNMIFLGYWEDHYPENPVTFMRWSITGIPFALLLLAAAYFTLKFIFIPKKKDEPFDHPVIKNKYRELGKMKTEQKIVSAVFAFTALLWFTRSGFNLGSFNIPGWEEFFVKGFIRDSTVAVFMALLLFLIPSINNKEKKFLLEWNDVAKLPLRIIFLFGGGFALAEGFDKSGFTVFLAEQLKAVASAPYWLVVLVLVTIITVLSEFASNVATITLMLPVLASLSAATGIDPIKLMVPATFAASFGFMMPIATAPNTLVFSSGSIRVKQMMRTGLVMNITGIILITLLMSWIEF